MPSMPKMSLPDAPKISLPDAPKISLPDAPKISLPDKPNVNTAEMKESIGNSANDAKGGITKVWEDAKAGKIVHCGVGMTHCCGCFPIMCGMKTLAILSYITTVIYLIQFIVFVIDLGNYEGGEAEGFLIGFGLTSWIFMALIPSCLYL